MYTAQKNNKRLKRLYEQSLHIKSAIPHPMIMGVIRGKYFWAVANINIDHKNANRKPGGGNLFRRRALLD